MAANGWNLALPEWLATATEVAILGLLFTGSYSQHQFGILTVAVTTPATSLHRLTHYTGALERCFLET